MSGEVQSEIAPNMYRQMTVDLRHIGWIHPAHGKARILDNGAKACLQERAPEDPTYEGGWVPVYAPDSGSGEASTDG